MIDSSAFDAKIARFSTDGRRVTPFDVCVRVRPSVRARLFVLPRNTFFRPPHEVVTPSVATPPLDCFIADWIVVTASIRDEGGSDKK